jgi:hypothetical protein
MKKLMLILLAFIAVFTYIRTFEEIEASEASPEITSEISISSESIIEIPVEIIH